MLKPASDRLDYSEMLMPPYGYETVFAVGTTYSLDLDALIGASIALGLSESIDNELKDNPIYLLEALQKTAEKVLIFCEGGQIKVPSNSNALHILLEKMVVEVVMKNKKSFHPKFRLTKYKNEDDEVLYRCLVLSRNLIFDRSWDIAVGIEGTYKNGNGKTKPLHDFLLSLTKLAKRNEIDKDKRKELLNLAEEIMNVNFKLNEKEFTDFSFHPVGIENYDIEDTGLFNNYHELLIISPFLRPFWCLPDDQKIKIERIIASYPLSKDIGNYQRLIKILSLYRLTLGQARQEALLEHIFKNCKDSAMLKELFINLSPYYREKNQSCEVI